MTNINRFYIAFIIVLMLISAQNSYAQSSLGIGSSEMNGASPPFFKGIFLWIAFQQKEFYRALTLALQEAKTSGVFSFALVFLSFSYGVLHAAGPGHGKIVISSYMLMPKNHLKNGIILAFLSSFLQALSAIIIISLGFLILRGTQYKMSDAVYLFEMASFILLTLLGAYLLWKLFARKHTHEDHHCSSCGHSHAPAPAQHHQSALSTVFAVGLRPCTGALFVLTFATLNQLYLIGIACVFAMAFGTALTVSTLALLTLYTKNLALTYVKFISHSRLIWIFELIGALFIFIIGLSLLLSQLV